MSDLVVRAYPLPTAANVGKLERVARILPVWQRACGVVAGQLLRVFHETGRLPKYLDTKDLDCGLSQRHLKSVVNQARAALQGWADSRLPVFRELVTKSNLDAEAKVALYRINAARAWFVPDFTLDGAPIGAETMRLARHMFRHLTKRRHSKPNLGRVRTMLMDGPIVRLEPSRTTEFDYWLNLATLVRGKVARIPLRLTRYTEAAPGKFANYAQVRVTDTGVVSFSLVKKSKRAQPRTSGRVVGLDWGLKSLFTTSDGQLLGIQLFQWLQDRDTELTELTASLQRQGIRLKTNRRYRALNSRIREYVKNEIGRILNLLTKKDIREIVVENLDFRHGGLSRRLNRILTRAGRGAIAAKLKDVTDRHGITVTKVNPAYTSQTCTGCGYTHRLNRNGTRFKCRFCHKALHADINAARNLVVRRSNNTIGGLYVSKQKIKAHLDQTFQQRWGLTEPGLRHPRPIVGGTAQQFA